MLRILFAALVLLFVVAVFVQIKKRYLGLGPALGMFVFVVAVGVWSIFQSASSTAAIGLLFMPFYALFSALLTWLFANMRVARRLSLRLLSWLVLLAALAVPVLLVYEGFQSIRLKETRAAKHKADSQEITSNQRLIKEAVARQPGREVETINRLLAEHPGERNYLLPLLESPFASPDVLDRMAASDDLGIALTAIRNPNCPAATLERIYRTHSYPDYFFQALAAHSNTPVVVLSELYRRPQTINGLDRSFAANPATPRDILEEIAERTKESFVVQRLLANPKVDCELLAQIELALQRSERPDDSHSRARLQELKGQKCSPLNS